MAANDNPHSKIQFRLPGIRTSEALSRAHGPASRGGPAEADELLVGVKVKQHFDLSAPSRAVGQEETAQATDQEDVVAVELEGGFMLYTSPGRLADDLQRLEHPSERRAEAGALALDRLRLQGPATRGMGDWFLRAFSVLGLDDLIAKELGKPEVQAMARRLLGDRVIDAFKGGAAWAGAKVLMWAIERRLEREPGLYRWVGDEPGSAELLAAARSDFGGDWLPDQPVLVFIHGTGSSTRGSFGDLGRPDAARDWEPLRAQFGQHIYGFEHYTFSQSPIENALALARALPAGARLCLVTHSRGGLVGDLLCLAGLDARLVEEFKRNDERFQAADEEDRRNLLELARLLGQKGFRIERYVRVACPAQGTLLAASHIDAFLSTLLHLVGLVPGVAGTPLYPVVKRIVLEAWSVEGGKPGERPQGIKQALEESVKWYQRGEGIPGEPGFSPYAMQNRLALQAVLGTAQPEDAALAERAGEIAQEGYARSRDYFDLIMAADGVLIARLIDGNLASTKADQAQDAIIASYRNVREQIPESARQLDSVVRQIELLAHFLEARDQVEGRDTAGKRRPRVVARLRRIADTLQGIAGEPGPDEPEGAALEPPVDVPGGAPLDSNPPPKRGAPAPKSDAPSAEPTPPLAPSTPKQGGKKSPGKKR